MSTPVLVNWSGIFGLLITVIFSQVLPGCRILSYNITSISLFDWAILIILALSGLLAFTCMTHALQLISPNIVSSLRTLELVIAFSVQALITGASPDPWTCCGALFVLSGVLMLSFQDSIQNMLSIVRVSPYVGFYQTIPSSYERIGD